MSEVIKLSLPHMGGNERKYIDRAFALDWVLPLGPEVDEFEERLSAYLGADKPVVALSAGTAAIHLGLVMLGVGRDDEVICQSLTFSASANPVVYCGGRPVFVDSEPETMNMSPSALEEAIESRLKATGRLPKAIIPVHLYGMPAKMAEISAISARYAIPIVEDAAEALGSTYKGHKCGTLGQFGALSFNGNKVITTSGGGALVCPSEKDAERVKFLATQARENRPYYYHETIGYNYRLSNISGAIGCGQMEVLPDRVERRKAIHSLYSRLLGDIDCISVQNNPDSDFDSNFWLTTIQIDPGSSKITPDQLRIKLWEDNIETRLLWRPMHMQPVFADCPYYGGTVSERLFEHGLCLPSGSVLTDEQIIRVAEAIRKHLS